MADSQKYGRTANLFNYTTMADGGEGYLNANGELLYSDSWKITQYIPCDGDAFVLSKVGGNVPAICFYDNSHNFIYGKAYDTGGAYVKRDIICTLPANAKYIRFTYNITNTPDQRDDLSTIMLNEGSTALPYEPYLDWQHSLRKLTTATEAVENPLYADGTAITSYTIKGNTVQNGTPSPQNPVMPNGVGNKTANLLAPDSKSTNQSGQERNGGYFTAGTYYILNNTSAAIFWRDGISDTSSHPIAAGNGEVVTTTDTLVVWHSGQNTSVMVAASSTAIPFEPYGYKIPISSAGQTIDIYIGDLPLLKSLDGTAVDEISNDTLTRRVDSDGSVLPTPTTTQITMPSIPTTDGANSITVDTTVQPSEFTATWTGWHNAEVKEWDGSAWS